MSQLSFQLSLEQSNTKEEWIFFLTTIINIVKKPET